MHILGFTRYSVNIVKTYVSHMILPTLLQYCYYHMDTT